MSFKLFLLNEEKNYLNIGIFKGVCHDRLEIGVYL